MMRYRWWAVGIAWGVSVIGWIIVYSLPNVYQASAKVFVDTNSLLRPLMQGLTAEQNPLDAVQLVSRTVLTRPNLETVANATDLTLTARSQEEEQEIVTNLQRRIRVSGGQDNVFTVEYQNQSRTKAIEVVAAVVDTIVEDAIGSQGDDADVTERALASEIRAHEDRLNAAETTLAEFKKENIGYMPGEAGDYYDRLQSALATIQSKEEEIRLITERREELRRQIEGEEPVFGIMPNAMGQGDTACSQNVQLAELREQLAGLLVAFTARHPRVASLEQNIRSLEERCAKELETAIAAGSSPAPQAGQPLELNPVFQNLRIQLSDAEVQVVTLRAELRSYQETVAQLRRDVDKIAQVETKFRQLNRDYDVIQGRHQQLLTRWEDLQATRRLDPVTDDVRFQRIEPAFALATPVGPNRPLLLGIVFVLAIGAGLAVTFGLNQIKPVFFTTRMLGRALELPVIGYVSMVAAPLEEARRRTAALVWAGTYVALVVATLAVVTWSQPGSLFVRSLFLGGVA
jgi:polysaccharide chain length determinant protein (PEP-CTERM system associated)